MVARFGVGDQQADARFALRNPAPRAIDAFIFSQPRYPPAVLTAEQRAGAHRQIQGARHPCDAESFTAGCIVLRNDATDIGVAKSGNDQNAVNGRVGSDCE